MNLVTATRLNPLTNGSRIRTGSLRPHPARTFGLNPLTNGSRIRTVIYLRGIRRRMVSIPLRTGLGFERYPPVNTCQNEEGLNPLTNGSRIRTTRSPAPAASSRVSIPLRTGLGFERSVRGRSRDRWARLNPLTNGSRIRTAYLIQESHNSWSLNPLTNGSRIRTALLRPPGKRTIVSIPLRTGLGFERRHPGKPDNWRKSQSPYERVSDSNSRTDGG